MLVKLLEIAETNATPNTKLLFDEKDTDFLYCMGMNTTQSSSSKEPFGGEVNFSTK